MNSPLKQPGGVRGLRSRHGDSLFKTHGGPARNSGFVRRRPQIINNRSHHKLSELKDYHRQPQTRWADPSTAVLKWITIAALLCCPLGQMSLTSAVRASATNSSERLSVISSLHGPQSQSGTTQQDLVPLGQNDRLKKDLAGGQKHAYKIALNEGQYIRVVIEPQRIDLLISIYKPDGQKSFQGNSPESSQGREVVLILAETSGDYRIEIQPPDKWAAPGSYELRVEGMSSLADKNYLAAQEATFEAGQLFQANKFEQAAQKYEQALLLWRAAENRYGETNVLHSLGNLYRSVKDLKRAETYYQQAISLRREIGDPQGEAQALSDLALAYQQLSSPEKSLEHLSRALKLFQANGNRQREATVLYQTGLSHALMGEMQKALEFYEQAQPIQQAEHDRSGELKTLNAMTGAYDGLGMPEMSLKRAEEVAQAWRERGDSEREAIAVINAALIYDEWGNWQKSLEYYRRALQIIQPPQQTSAANCKEAMLACQIKAAALDNMGALYAALNEPERALELHERSLLIRREIGEPRGIGTTIGRIGYALFLSGEPQIALERCTESLALLEQVSAKQYLANVLTVIGMIHASQKRGQHALDNYMKALELQKALKDAQGQAITLDKIGQVYDDSGDDKKSLESYDQALGFWRQIGDRNGEALTLYNLARAEQHQGRIAEARTHVRAALQTIEALRTNITNERLRTSYFTSRQNFYELEIHLEMHLHHLNRANGHDLLALEVSERARARNLIDLLAEARVGIHEGADSQLIELEQALRQKLSDKTSAAQKLSLIDKEPQRRLVVALAKEIKELSEQYDEVRTQLRKTSPRYAAITQVQPLSVKEIQQLLDDDTLLLEYTLGEENSYLWAVSKGQGVSSYILPGRQKIEAGAREIYELLTAQEPAAGEAVAQRRERLTAAETQYDEAANAFSEMVLGPVADLLGKKRLIIVSDGALQYLPFGALPSPQLAAGKSRLLPLTQAERRKRVPLIADHEIVSLPSASTLAMLRSQTVKRNTAIYDVAVVADPVFAIDDPRFNTANNRSPALASIQKPSSVKSLRLISRENGGGSDIAASVSRLPFSRQEAAAIATITPRGQSMEAMGFEASYETATNGKLSQYRIVHFATHGLLDSENPELSGLILSLFDEQGLPKKKGFLGLTDIYNLNLSAELVVLSACKTGLGKEIRGEGLIGLTQGFMYAGASRVVASLWRINDEATAELMKYFYSYLLKDKMKPATALRMAQIEMQKKGRWRHPYYWAAFVIQGDWK